MASSVASLRSEFLRCWPRRALKVRTGCGSLAVSSLSYSKVVVGGIAVCLFVNFRLRSLFSNKVSFSSLFCQQSITD